MNFETIILAFFTDIICLKRGRNGRFGILSKKKLKKTAVQTCYIGPFLGAGMGGLA